MKKFNWAILFFALCILFTACDPTDPSRPSETTVFETIVQTTKVSETTQKTATEKWMGGDDSYHPGTYRGRYQSMPVQFAKIVGIEKYQSWISVRMEEWANGNEEIMNECTAVAFVKHFNVSKEDFTRANEEFKKFYLATPNYDPEDPLYEVYDVDLIYTFDNQKINEYFLWENWPYDGWWSEGLE
jgi:hypothetical protein